MLYSDVIFLEMPFSRNIFCAFHGFVMLRAHNSVVIDGSSAVVILPLSS